MRINVPGETYVLERRWIIHDCSRKLGHVGADAD